MYNLTILQRLAEKTLHALAKGYPVVAVTGPRQSGKTTLVQKVFSKKAYISLEDPDIVEQATLDPRGFLARYPQGVILDEVQRCPSLFSYIQTICDQKKQNGLFVLTGLQQFGLMSSITQSLAGRVGFVHLLPFSIAELAVSHALPKSLAEMLFKGGYPPLYNRKLSPQQWFANYVLTYLERDVRATLQVRDLSLFQRFLRMCAARTGQLLNLSALANDCGISSVTARQWLSILEASYIVFLLQPHFANFGKRLVKTPKLYFYDSGLAAWLMNIQNIEHLETHVARGALFETLIVSELLKSRYNKGLASNLYFWRNNLGDEIDILIDQGALTPVEIKSGETFTASYAASVYKWRKISEQSLPGYVVYGGTEKIVDQLITYVPWRQLQKNIVP